MSAVNKPSSPQDFLRHYGVKGMKWGVKKAVKEAVDEQRRIDKEILDARKKLPEKRRELKTAKKQYKSDRKEVGRAAAKKALRPVRDEYYSTFAKALERTSIEKIEDALDEAILNARVNAIVKEHEQKRSK